MKKILIGFFVFFVLLVLALGAIPMIYDVDAKVRPLVLAAIEQNLNAKAELGKLNLSLWGRVRVGISSMAIKEKLPDGSAGPTVFEVRDAHLDIPFLALLTGKIKVDFVAMAPSFFVVSDKEGKLNVFKLMKNGMQDDHSQAPTPEKSANASASAAMGGLSITIDIEKANLVYKDLKAGTQSAAKDLSVRLIDVGVNRPFKVESDTDLNFSGPSYSLKGPVALRSTAEVHMASQGFESLSLKADLELAKLDLQYGQLFRKKLAVPLRLELDMVANDKSLKLNAAEVVVNDLKVMTTGTIENFENPSVDLNIKSNNLQFEQWRHILAAAQDFNLTGQTSFNVHVQGPLSKIQYSGAADLKNLGATLPGMKVPMTDLQSHISLETDLLKIEKMSLRLGQSDLSLTATIKNFSAPVIRGNVQSQFLNMDEMFPPTPSKTMVNSNKAGAEEEEIRDDAFEGPVAKIKKNPSLRNLDFFAQAKVAKVLIRNAQITDLIAQMEFKNLIFTLKNASLKAFGGKANMALSCDFSGAVTSYSVKGDVSGMDVNAAITSQFADLKDSLKGFLNAKMNLAGQGTRVSEVKKNLKGNGDIKLNDGAWSALAGMKMMAEKLKSIPGAKEKIGGMSMGDKFKTMKSNFTIRDARFNIEKADMEMQDSHAALFGDGFVTFDKTMFMKGDIWAPLGEIPKSIRTPDGRARVPYEIEGPMMGPNVKWEVTTNALASAYLRSEGEKMAQKEIQKLKDNVKDENVKKILEKVPEGVGDLLKGIKF